MGRSVVNKNVVAFYARNSKSNSDIKQIMAIWSVTISHCFMRPSWGGRITHYTSPSVRQS